MSCVVLEGSMHEVVNINPNRRGAIYCKKKIKKNIISRNINFDEISLEFWQNSL
jgi:hypothetical protein